MSLPPRPTAAPPLLNGTLDDTRIYYDRASSSWRCEVDDSARESLGVAGVGVAELEWVEGEAEEGRWKMVLDEEEVRRQQEAYGVKGVDEETPAAPIARRLAKRSAAEAEIDHTGASGPSKASKPAEKAPRERGPKQTTAVFVAGLPLDATLEEIASVFERYGVLAEGEDGKPRVRIYEDEKGRPKGEALVTYFKAESVELAVAVLDESCLRAAQGQQTPLMHVSKAEWKPEKGKKKAERKEEEEKKPKEKRTEQEKKEARRRFEKLNGKLTAWDSDEDDFGPSGPSGAPALPGAKAAGSAGNEARVVVLEKMFTLAELAADPTLLLDLKEDVREECEGFGKVTACTLWDKEPQGIISVKFSTPAAAAACVQKMAGRFFGGRSIVAYLAAGKPKFRRSGVEDDAEEEAQRNDAFGEWLDGGGDGDE